MSVLIPDRVAQLAPFVEAGVLGSTEVHLADWVLRAASVVPADAELVSLGVAFAAWAALHGHVCADLTALPVAVSREHRSDDGESAGVPLAWPVATAWLAALQRAAECGVVRVVDGPDPTPVLDEAPLVLWGTRLYLQRHWVDESTIAALLRARATAPDDLPTLTPRATALLDRLVPATETDRAPSQQRRAAELVFARRLSLVVGGPGTGKTYSVARVLMALLTDAHERGDTLSVALAAPTGKAAARLEESIRAAVDEVERAENETSVPSDDRLLPEVKQQLLGLAPTTVHRLLGTRYPIRNRFRHDIATPLHHDVVIIDETSMVSMPLLARLLEAVRPEARLVLIGDPDQLESVELGSVLGDIVQACAQPDGPVAGHMERLLRGRRFTLDSPIARLADSVREDEPDRAIECLHGSGLVYVPTERPNSGPVVAAVAKVLQPVLTGLREAAEQGDAGAALNRLLEARILCAHRMGQFGVEFWNRLSEQWLRGSQPAMRTWYPGRPVLVTKNDVRLGLANGDMGVVVCKDNELKVAFTKVARNGAVEGVRLVNPVDLADVETAYAMTIHKSQGSEYGTVVLVLPPATSPLVGRELVYTAITRAKGYLVVVGSEAAMRACIATPARRMTGLAEALR